MIDRLSLSRLRQRALDVLDLAERLCLLLPRGSALEEECFHTGACVSRCLRLLDERPSALWALDELTARAARLAAVFTEARSRGFLDDERAAEALTLAEDLLVLARALRRRSEGDKSALSSRALVTSRRPPSLLA